MLVEAQGVGLTPSDPRVSDPRHWKGDNTLGFALMGVRSALGGDPGITRRDLDEAFGDRPFEDPSVSFLKELSADPDCLEVINDCGPLIGKAILSSYFSGAAST